jgi:hypothetical protein
MNIYVVVGILCGLNSFDCWTPLQMKTETWAECQCEKQAFLERQRVNDRDFAAIGASCIRMRMPDDYQFKSRVSEECKK